VADKLPQVSGARLVRALERGGWYVSRQDGSHAQMKLPGRSGVVTVSIHKSKPIPPGTLRRILDDTGVTVERLKELL
jgi:predicted RNA binding protein YcfA (HicA-like mRNA interferase family)